MQLYHLTSRRRFPAAYGGNAGLDQLREKLLFQGGVVDRGSYSMPEGEGSKAWTVGFFSWFGGVFNVSIKCSADVNSAYERQSSDNRYSASVVTIAPPQQQPISGCSQAWRHLHTEAFQNPGVCDARTSSEMELEVC